MPPRVDLVIEFRSAGSSKSHGQSREELKKTEEQYTRLLKVLVDARLQAVGRRGEALGHILVFVYCPDSLLQELWKQERQTDFLSGLQTTSRIHEDSPTSISSADRLRLIYGYITSIPSEGGLGVIPKTKEWDLVESITCLHDKEFNKRWIHEFASSPFVSVSNETVKDQFGDSVALYFDFLRFYTRSLVFPAILGLAFFIFSTPYSPLYSFLLLIWSTIFVESWRVRERLISIRFGTRGSFRVEKRRAQWTPGFSWWQRELRMLASLPVILLFAGLLVALLSSIFVFEAFVTQLYNGPGQKYLTFSPTVLFVLLVPRLLGVYQAFIQRFTAWENHAHHSTHLTSLTLKTFALSSLVAYLGLALSAFVYVPFGEGLMRIVQVWLFKDRTSARAEAKRVFNVSTSTEDKIATAANISSTSWSHPKLNPRRLRDQMFAYTVTQQISNTFMEVGLPYVLRAVASFRNGKSNGRDSSADSSASGKEKKKVIFEDEKEKGGMAERQFLNNIRQEISLPEYDLFGDYNEMVMQFGYVAAWSTIWPLAPVMALINNIFELRSDAFKITVHHRRPMPSRTDTIGPWLDALTFLTWLSALSNSALVYLFSPWSANIVANGTSPLDKVHEHLFILAGTVNSTVPLATSPGDSVSAISTPLGATKELLGRALLIALGASHGFIILRGIIRHLVEKVMWHGSEDVKKRQQEEREIKAVFLKRSGIISEAGAEPKTAPEANDTQDEAGFWDHDEGVEEIGRISKEA